MGAIGNHGPIIAVGGFRATSQGRRSAYARNVNDILVLPTGRLADASIAIARSSVRRPIVDHSIRSFLFARLLADREGSLSDAEYDEDMLFAATVMHDLGLGEHAPGEARFEVEGADLAADVLRKHGVAEPDINRVWEAIALHSSVGIADRCGLLTSLTHRGVFIDAGRVTDALADRLRQDVLSAYPRSAGDRSIADAIVAHATRSEAAAPPGSLAFELLRQHREAEGARVSNQEPT
jgi:HD domain-containing protein